MNPKRILEKIEHDLSHFLINELSKSTPDLKGSSEIYKYKGLSVSANPKSTKDDKSISVRIGALEASFRINGGDKTSGALSPEEERLIYIWISRSENSHYLKSIFSKNSQKEDIVSIIPFDLEHFYTN